MPNHDDERLVNACYGSQEAFAELIARYQQVVFGVCLTRTGNGTEAEDLAQEVFLKVYTQLHSLRDPACFASWLYRIAENHCGMWHRQQERNRTLNQLWWEQYQGLQVPETSSNTDGLLQSINKLPHMDRLVLVLHYWSGMSCQQIGVSLGTSADAVKVRLSRARSHLREEGTSMLQAELSTGAISGDIQARVLSAIDIQVGRHRQDGSVVGLAAVGRSIHASSWWKGMDALPLLCVVRGEVPSNRPVLSEHGMRVHTTYLSMLELQSIVDWVEGKPRWLAYVWNALYDAHIYYDPEQILAQAKARVRRERFTRGIHPKIVRWHHLNAQEGMSGYQQAFDAHDWPACLWHLRTAAWHLSCAVLEQHQCKAMPEFQSHFPEFAREKAIEIGHPELYSLLMKVERLGKTQCEVKELTQILEQLIHAQQTHYFDSFPKLVGQFCKEMVPRDVLPKAVSITRRWAQFQAQYHNVSRLLDEGHPDRALWILRCWFYSSGLCIFFELENLLTGNQTQYHARADILKALSRLGCMRSDVYELILRFYEWEDASEPLVLDTAQAVERIRTLL